MRLQIAIKEKLESRQYAMSKVELSVSSIKIYHRYMM